MASKVRTGDPSNVEGQAARTYWSLMLGPTFRRDPDSDGINALLNYGYVVLRAAVARQLMAAGLHPGIPLHHANEGNPMRLVDDMMEPFRPMVDVWVRRIVESGCSAVTADSKRSLALLPTRSLHTRHGVSPVALAVQRLCISLAQAYEDPTCTLELPPCTAAALRSLWEEPHATRQEEEED